VLPLLLAVVVAYLIGGASGYLTRGLTAGPAAAAGSVVSACPAGSHAVVWYTARTWECASN
jgi:hypothetical protein